MACLYCRAMCEECGEETAAEYARSVYVRPRVGTRVPPEATWCRDCRECDSWTCDECGDTYAGRLTPSYAEADVEGDRPLCTPCAEARDAASGPPVRYAVGPYHDTQRKARTRAVPSPWAKAHGGRLFGVELEVERVAGAPDLARLADDLLCAAHAVAPWRDQVARLMWAERDGSLCDGVELISAPAGLDVHRDLWRAVLACDAVKHFRSHDTGTCGLHVHVSRPGAWLTAKTAAWLAAPTSEELVRLVARRYGSSYAKMDARRLSRSTVHGYDRYQALNTTPTSTVEFRIFRGSLRAETVLAAVEFAHAVLAYVEDSSAADLAAADTAARFVRRIHAPDLHADTHHLRAFLARRTAERPTRAPRILAALAALPPRKTDPTRAATLATVATESEAEE